MHHNMLTDNKKSFIVKVIFFLALLSCVALIYFESGLVKDAVYFMLVLAFFIKYLKIIPLMWYNFFGDIYVN